MADEEFQLTSNDTTESFDTTAVLTASGNSVTGISGTVNGVTIDGLSNFNNADNTITLTAAFRANGALFYSVDSNGLSFSAAGIQYNISYNLNSGVGTGVIFQDNITEDDAGVVSADVATTVIQQLCFVAGTLIRTTKGEIAVENLQIGDLVVTASGAVRPVVWTGSREVACGSRGSRSGERPVRILARAFDGKLPERDLYLSPGHPVLVGTGADEALVPIMCLINGTTIARASIETVTYWHVELDEHDILLAEGLPAESYIDLGSRPWFDGADGALHDPDLVLAGQPGRCRPVAVDGPMVQAERRRLDSIFAMKLKAASAWPSRDGALSW